METKPVLDKNGVEIKRGDRVRIIKGTIVKNSGPGDKIKIAGRSHLVKVHSIYRSFEEYNYDNVLVKRNARVVWAGAGNWHECDACDVINMTPRPVKLVDL